MYSLKSILKHSRYLRLNCLFLATSFFSCTVMANMSVYPMELDIDASGTAQIKVASKSDDVQFVRVSQKKVINPGTREEKEIDVASWKEGGMVVTPPKFALAAGGMRVVRLVALTPPEIESTWRVYFEGVSQPDNLLSKLKESPASDAKLGVNVIWGALVHLAPKNPVISLRIDPLRKSLINDGTLRIPLRGIGVCLVNAPCQWFKETITVYPGTHRTLNSLSFVDGARYKFRYFNWLKKTVEEADLPVTK